MAKHRSPLRRFLGNLDQSRYLHVFVNKTALFCTSFKSQIIIYTNINGMNPARKKKRPDVNDDELMVSVNEVSIRKGVVLGSLSNTLIK